MHSDELFLLMRNVKEYQMAAPNSDILIIQNRPKLYDTKVA